MDPIFNGMQKPSTDFTAVRGHLRTTPSYFDIDLSTARSVAAGSQLVVGAPGNFLYVDQLPGSGYASIHFEDINPLSTPITIFPGACFRIPFTVLAFENAAQPGLKLRILIGTDVQFEPSNVAGVSILNAVSVVDGGKARTLAGQSFLGRGPVGPVAAQLSHSQLKMPAAATVRAVLEGFICTVAGAGAQNIFLAEYDPDLTTPLGNAAPKKMGGASSVALLQGQTNAALLSPNRQMQFAVTGPTTVTYSFKEPVTIAPGTGILMMSDLVNQLLIVNWEFFEEPNT